LLCLEKVMLRKALISLLLLFFLLSACQQGSQPGGVLPTNTLKAAFPTRASTRTKAPGCTVVSPQPTPGPTEQSLFPAHKDSDWVMGPLTATVTVIEYGDYQ
jgi:hypothetical protein